MTLFAAEAFFYNGVSRWDFGLDNPNKAAAVLAFLLLALLALSVRARREWVRWCAGAAMALVGYGLVHTFSRGGLVAFLAGAVVVLAGVRKSLFRERRWLPVLLATCTLVGAAAWTGFAGRVANSSPAADDSVGNRFVIWRNVPCMMVDAPGGWGHGAAGDAFMSWYQPLDRKERYRTLVNSHFTWLVEWGWCGRFVLVWAWLLALGMGIVRWRSRGDPLPLAVWIGFATAAFFSSVAEEWIVWVVPVFVLVPAVLTFRTAKSARRLTIVATLVASGLVLSAFVVVGMFCRPVDAIKVNRSLDGMCLTVGTGETAGWLVCDETAMGGAAYGRVLRDVIQTPEGSGRAYCLARELSAVPADVRRLALCGHAADTGPGALSRFTALEDVRVIAPNRPEEWLAAHGNKPYIHVFCGEFASACPVEDVDGLTVVPGAADYLPNWPQLAFGSSSGRRQLLDKLLNDGALF